MLFNFRLLPPVGNKIINQQQNLPDNFFAPFYTYFYQSGTAALSAAISIAKSQRKDIKEPEVIIPAYACPDLISAAIFAGVKPRLVDLAIDSSHFDLTKLKTSLTDSVIAVISVNFLGITDNISKIKALVGDKVFVIEDSAQAFPLKINATSWQGDLIISSFGRGKPLSLLGGGILLTKNKNLINFAPKAQDETQNYFDSVFYQFKIFIYNRLLNPFFYFWLSKLPLLKLGDTRYKSLEHLTTCPNYMTSLFSKNYAAHQQRNLINQHYHKMLTELNTNKIIDLASTSNHHLQKPLLRYPILINDKQLYDKLIINFRQNGIGASTMYKSTLPEVRDVLPEYYTLLENIDSAKEFAIKLITLPTHSAITIKDLALIKHILETEVNKVNE